MLRGAQLNHGGFSMKRLFASLAAAACIAAPQGPALAITDGAPDGQGHPYVGLLVFDVDGDPAWRCSGTLLSPDHFC
jgi:hypothetical protein